MLLPPPFRACRDRDEFPYVAPGVSAKAERSRAPLQRNGAYLHDKPVAALVAEVLRDMETGARSPQPQGALGPPLRRTDKWRVFEFTSLHLGHQEVRPTTSLLQAPPEIGFS
jgi:hypothetical protein